MGSKLHTYIIITYTQNNGETYYPICIQYNMAFFTQAKELDLSFFFLFFGRLEVMYVHTYVCVGSSVFEL